MRESTMETIMEKHCFGDPPDNEDSEILAYGDQFLYGLNKMKGLYEDAATVDTAQDTVVLTMLPSLHCQSGLNIFVGEGSIEKGLLYRKSLTKTNQMITGRTLLRLAKDVICNCKKMLALMTDATSPYVDGSYPSGMNWMTMQGGVCPQCTIVNNPRHATPWLFEKAMKKSGIPPKKGLHHPTRAIQLP